MNDKPILYEDKIKDRDNDFLYNKCVNQYHQLMNCQCKNKEYKNKINNLQSKIDKAIEYIKIQQKIFKDYDIVSENQLNNLLDILKEDRNETKNNN